MSTFVEDLAAYLKANAGIGAIVGTRVYPQNLPQKSATSNNLPAVVYIQVSGARPSSMEGVTGLNDGRYQFACMALDYLTAKQLSQAVREALSKLKGAVGGSQIFDSSLLAERDIYDSIELTFRCDLDFQIWHSEPSTGLPGNGNSITNGVLFAALGSAWNDDSVVNCTDCAGTNPCTAGGTGAIAQYRDGAWNCGGGDVYTAGNNTLTGNNTLLAGKNSLNFYQHNNNFWTGTSAAIYPFTDPQAQIANCLTLSQLGCKIQLVSASSFANSLQTDIGTANGAGNHTIVIEGQPDVRWRFTGTAGGTTAAWSLHNGSALVGSNIGSQAGGTGNRQGGFALTYDCAAKSAYGLSTAEGLTGVQAFGLVRNIFMDGCPTGTVGGGGSPSVAMFNWEGISSANEVSNITIAQFANTVGFRVAGNAASGVTGPLQITNVWSQAGYHTGAIPCVVQNSGATGVILPLVFTTGACNNPGSGMDAFFIDSSAGTNNLWGLHSTGQYFEDQVNGNSKMVHIHHAGNILFETPTIVGIIGDTGFYLDQNSAGGTGMVQITNFRMNLSTVTAINNTITGFTLSGFQMYPFYHYGGKSNTVPIAPMFIDDNDLALTSTSMLHLYNGTFTGLTNYERGFARWNGNVFEVGTEQLGTGASRDFRVKASAGAGFRLNTSGADRWTVQSAGHFVANTDNTLDIGASGANRPRNLFLGGTLTPGTSTFAGLGAVPAAGTSKYCTDCATAATCAGSGTGHMAVSNGTNWTCQ